MGNLRQFKACKLTPVQCIPEKNVAEKHFQISQMDRIYSEALFTIIAAAGENPYYGLPGVGARHRRPQRHAVLKDCTLIEIYPYTKQRLRSSKWADRAWTFQEGFLSQRRLIFDDEQVSFVCGHTFCAESFTGAAPYARLSPALDFSDLFANAAHDATASDVAGVRRLAIAWCLQEYSTRQLTFENDALKACMGVLNHFRSRRIKGHLCGVLIRTDEVETTRLEIPLSWYHQTPCRRRRDFPSWTWIGWEGKAFGLQSYTRCDYDIKIQAHNNDNKWVPVKEYVDDNTIKVQPRIEHAPRLLQMTGRCLNFRLVEKAPDALSTVKSKRLPLENIYAIFDSSEDLSQIFQVFLDSDTLKFADLDNCIAIVAEICHSNGLDWPAHLLLLKPIGDRYRRVGLIACITFKEYSHGLCDKDGSTTKIHPTEARSLRSGLRPWQPLEPLCLKRATRRTIILE